MQQDNAATITEDKFKHAKIHAWDDGTISMIGVVSVIWGIDSSEHRDFARKYNLQNQKNDLYSQFGRHPSYSYREMKEMIIHYSEIEDTEEMKTRLEQIDSFFNSRKWLVDVKNEINTHVLRRGTDAMKNHMDALILEYQKTVDDGVPATEILEKFKGNPKKRKILEIVDSPDL